MKSVVRMGGLMFYHGPRELMQIESRLHCCTLASCLPVCLKQRCSCAVQDVTRREWRQTAATPCMSHHANDLPAQAWLAACKVLKDARPDVQLLVDKWETEDEMPQPAGMEFVLP